MTALGDLQALVIYQSQKQSSTTLIGNNAIAVQMHAVTTDMLCLFWIPRWKGGKSFPPDTLRVYLAGSENENETDKNIH